MNTTHLYWWLAFAVGVVFISVRPVAAELLTLTPHLLAEQTAENTPVAWKMGTPLLALNSLRTVRGRAIVNGKWQAGSEENMISAAIHPADSWTVTSLMVGSSPQNLLATQDFTAFTDHSLTTFRFNDGGSSSLLGFSAINDEQYRAAEHQAQGQFGGLQFNISRAQVGTKFAAPATLAKEFAHTASGVALTDMRGMQENRLTGGWQAGSGKLAFGQTSWSGQGADISNRNLNYQGGAFTVAFSHTDVAHLGSGGYTKTLLKSFNDQWKQDSVGSILGFTPQASNAKTLDGLDVQHSLFGYAPSGSFGFRNERLSVDTAGGSVKLETSAVTAGRLHIQRGTRAIDAGVTAGALKTLGFAGLAGNVGQRVEFTQYDYSPTAGLNCTRFEQTTEKVDNPAKAPRTDLRRDTVDWTLHSGWKLGWLNESSQVTAPKGTQTDTNMSRMSIAGRPLNQTDVSWVRTEREQTARAATCEDMLNLTTTLIPKSTFKAVSRNFDGNGGERKRLYDLDVKPATNVQIAAKVTQDDHADNIKHLQSVVVNMQDDAKRKLTVQWSDAEQGPSDQVTSTDHVGVSVEPEQHVAVNLWQEKRTEAGGDPAVVQAAELQTNMGPVELQAKLRNEQTDPDTTAQTRTIAVGAKGPIMEWQAGMHATDPGAGKGDSRQTTFVRVASQPKQGPKFSFGYADRQDLAKDPLIMRDWSIQAPLGDKLSLQANYAYNQPKNPAQLVNYLPLPKEVVAVDKSVYRLTYQLRPKTTLQAAYDITDHIGQNGGESLWSLSYVSNPAPQHHWLLKYSSGSAINAGISHDYSVYEAEYGYKVGDGREISLRGRVMSGDVQLRPSDSKVDITFVLHLQFG